MAVYSVFQILFYSHWPLEDPAAALGSDAERMPVFRRVRDELMQRIREFLGDPVPEFGNVSAAGTAGPTP